MALFKRVTSAKRTSILLLRARAISFDADMKPLECSRVSMRCFSKASKARIASNVLSGEEISAELRMHAWLHK